MNTKKCRRQLALDLCMRSSVFNKMAAVLSDNHGIYAWGWNSSGYNGLGWHAEAHCISRCNRKRLAGSIITIAGVRKGKIITSYPCFKCLKLILGKNIQCIEYLEKGEWKCQK
jgi:deoxycytidylate deaminase